MGEVKGITVNELLAKLREIPVEHRNKEVVFYTNEDGLFQDLPGFAPVIDIDSSGCYTNCIYLQNYPNKEN